jgi:hypothetical protein
MGDAPGNLDLGRAPEDCAKQEYEQQGGSSQDFLHETHPKKKTGGAQY